MPIRPLLIALAFAATTVTAGNAQAVVLNFDDVPIADPFWEEEVTNYGGLTWSNTFAVDGGGYGAGTGYANAATSGVNAVLNGWGDPLSASSSSAFTFNGAYITGAFRDGMTVNVSGYLGGTLVGSVATTVYTSVSSWLTANFVNIDTVLFSSSFGTTVVDSPDFDEGAHFALDDFTINEAVEINAVPELDARGVAPALTLLACALVMLTGRRRRIPT